MYTIGTLAWTYKLITIYNSNYYYRYTILYVRDVLANISLIYK